KRAHHFHMRDGNLFAFAGLWDSRTMGDGSELASCCILTTEPNELVATVHNRMPVILPRTAYPAWLDPVKPKDALAALLRPYPADEMTEKAVGSAVNK